MKIIAFTLALLILGSPSTSFARKTFLDVPGSECRARQPDDAAGLSYKYDGEIRNVSDKLIKVICNFQLQDNFYQYYSVYVYGTGLSSGNRDVFCNLYVSNIASGSRKYKSGDANTNKDQPYRIEIRDVETKADVRGFDIVNLECFMDSNTTIRGMRLFRDTEK